MADVKIYDTIVKSEPITKGWSEDKKYCVTVANGTKYLLRVTPISRYETRKSLFAMMEQVAALNIPMCTPVEFGTCDDGVYSIQSWIDGEDLEMMLPTLSETEQYIWGLKAGEILRKIHTLPAPNNINDEMWFDVINEQIHEYRECGVIFENDEYVIDFINKQKHLMERRKKCFRHSDYHVGNMMIENDTLYIIDFDICDYGDPWEDLSGVVLGATYSPCFATGQLRGYFGGTPTDKEFNQVAFYIACNTLSSICWAALVGQVEIDYYLDKNKSVLRWFDNFQNPVPTWYLKDWRTAE